MDEADNENLFRILSEINDADLSEINQQQITIEEIIHKINSNKGDLC